MITLQPDYSHFRVIRLIGLANGEPSLADGEWVKEYNPSRDGTDPAGQAIGCLLVTTSDPAQARLYGMAEVLDVWNRVDARNPTRPDGKPNRPLTAYTVEITPPPPRAEFPTSTVTATDIPSGPTAGE